jgi:hypothetical protein
MSDGGERGGGPRPPSRYSIFVGIAFLVLIAIAAFNTFRSDEGGVLGAGAAEAGTELPEFAVPELIGGADADANVFQNGCETSERPCPADARRTAACEVDLPRVIRVCDLFDRPLVISFWFSDPDDCPPTQDSVAAAARDYRGEVNFLSLAVRGDRDQLAELVRERGWTLPIGWDRDGAVSNLYKVGVCPTVVFAVPGGILSEALIGVEELEPARLRRSIERLIERSRTATEQRP